MILLCFKYSRRETQKFTVVISDRRKYLKSLTYFSYSFTTQCNVTQTYI